MHYLMVDDFYPKAKLLRQVFERKFADPLSTQGERFVWDFWHVPGEYTHLRTPAFHYFPKAQYAAFHRYLVRWGRENLGCHDISPPWLSCYITGCKQEPHRDRPHGPLAFVYSLSPGGFSGGETFIKKPNILIKPKFNRLTLFNPALMHGVKEVKGTMDPRRGRLVIHGWFVQPRPFWSGPLTAANVAEGLESGLKHVPRWSSAGFLSVRLGITPAGRVRRVKLLVSTINNAETERWMSILEGLRFAPKKAYTQLTFPLMMS